MTEIMKHSLYIITDNSNGEEITLSFNGTKIGLQSTGAWAINTNADIKSYNSFKSGKNNFDMKLLIKSEYIDTEKTAEAIISSIDSNIEYFALDHKINLGNKENCNTALFNTVKIKDIEK